MVGSTDSKKPSLNESSTITAPKPPIGNKLRYLLNLRHNPICSLVPKQPLDRSYPGFPFSFNQFRYFTYRQTNHDLPQIHCAHLFYPFRSLNGYLVR